MSRVSEKKVGGNLHETVDGMFIHDNTIKQDVLIPASRNAISAGPITVDTGYTVTVDTGATWVVA